jgi:hypothetical protein
VVAWARQTKGTILSPQQLNLVGKGDLHSSFGQLLDVPSVEDPTLRRILDLILPIEAPTDTVRIPSTTHASNCDIITAILLLPLD